MTEYCGFCAGTDDVRGFKIGTFAPIPTCRPCRDFHRVMKGGITGRAGRGTA